MTRQKDGLSLQISSEAVEYWREYEETLRELEQAANRDPARFARRLLHYVAALRDERAAYIDYLRHRFGVEYSVRRIETEYRFRKTRVVDPKRFPRTRREKTFYDLARHEIMQLEVFFSILLTVIDRAEGNHADVDRAMCETFLQFFRSIPALCGMQMLKARNPEVRRAATLGLSGWLATQIKEFPRIEKALADEDTSLLEALPPAAMVSFDEREPREPLRPPGGRKKSLVSRVSDHIIKRGHEATVKEWVADEPPDETSTRGATEWELAEFALREDLRGALSEREYQIIVLTCQGFTEAEIAQLLGITKGNVKKTKSRARDKKSAELRRIIR
jgi:DNA-binding CsgD family transcriptional regulator